jgi:RNase adaptor protein for sRNA GlmZ degradation
VPNVFKVLTVSVARGSLVLPNPYCAIKKGKLGETHREILEWLCAQTENARKVDKLIEHAVNLLQTHDRIRIQCIGGKHRSQVIAREVCKRVLECEIDLFDAPSLRID